MGADDFDCEGHERDILAIYFPRIPIVIFVLRSPQTPKC